MESAQQQEDQTEALSPGQVTKAWFATIGWGVLTMGFCWLAAEVQTADLFAGPPTEPTSRELYLQKVWRWGIFGALWVTAWINCLFLDRSNSALLITTVGSVVFAGGPFLHYLLLS